MSQRQAAQPDDRPKPSYSDERKRRREQARLEALMIEGAKEMADEDRAIAEAALPLIKETYPRD